MSKKIKKCGENEPIVLPIIIKSSSARSFTMMSYPKFNIKIKMYYICRLMCNFMVNIMGSLNIHID